MGDGNSEHVLSTPFTKDYLEVVKREMATVNMDSLGISELKWTGKDEFHSDDHYIYHCGQKSLRKNREVLIVNKRVWNAVLGCNLINNRMISVYFQEKPFNIRVIQVDAPTTNVEEAEVEWVYEDLQELLELTPNIYIHIYVCVYIYIYPFHPGEWNTKVGSQEISGVTVKFGLGVQNEAEQRLSFAKRTY